jgi:hypothetical protein
MRHLSTLLLILILSACTGEKDKLAKLSWLSGSWQTQMPEGVFKESWWRDTRQTWKQGENQWQGMGVLLGAAGDTFFREDLRIISEKGELWYCPMVSNQNGKKEVRFKEKEITDHNFVFENLQHDFPQRICYELTSDTTIHAWIEGRQNGKERKEDFYFRKSR